jgi:hypothetical protein
MTNPAQLFPSILRSDLRRTAIPLLSPLRGSSLRYIPHRRKPLSCCIPSQVRLTVRVLLAT